MALSPSERRWAEGRETIEKSGRKFVLKKAKV
jgi:hypothetical protein